MQRSIFSTNTILILFFLLINGLFIPLHATHELGKSITYTCLGGSTYEIELKVYAYCNLNSPSQSENITISSSCTSSMGVALYLNSSQEHWGICLPELPNSKCSSNLGNLYGMEEHVYTGQVTLIPCNDWLIYFKECCRNPILTNSQNNATNNQYVAASLNNLAAPCNSSPRFTNTRIMNSINGNLNSMSFGGWDPNGDSLVFSLIDALSDDGVPITYIAPFSGSYPLTTVPVNSFGFDPTIGQMSFESTGIQLATVAVKAEKYRNGMLIGSSMTDRIVHTMNYVPGSLQEYQPPLPGSVSGGSINGQILETGVGQTLDFSFQFTDLDSSTLQLSSDIGTTIPGASLTTSGNHPLQVDFNWTTTIADSGFYYFTVSVFDDLCPFVKPVDVGFLIKVRPPTCNLIPDYLFTAVQDASGTLVNFTDNSSPAGSYNYFWTFGDGSFSTVMNPSHYYSDSTAIDSLQTYEVCLTINDGGNCAAASCDSITVFVNPSGGMTTGIKDHHALQQITVFPNPITDNSSVFLTSENTTLGMLSLFNINGNRMSEQSIQLSPGLQTLDLKTDHLVPGVYLIILETKQGIAVKRLIKL